MAAVPQVETTARRVEAVTRRSLAGAGQGKDPSAQVHERSRRTRAKSRELAAASARARARAEEVSRQAPYASVVGTRDGSPVRIVVRRNGTIVGDVPAAGTDPLGATLAAARNCDAVTSVMIWMAGRRPGVPAVKAAAALDGEDGVSAEDVQRRVADGLRSSVIQPLFAVGLKVSALRGRTADPFMRRQLDEIVAALDEVIADARFTVVVSPRARRDHRAPVRDRDLEIPSLVISELHAIGMAAQTLRARTGDPYVQEQLVHIVDWLGAAVADLQSMVLDATGDRRAGGATSRDGSTFDGASLAAALFDGAPSARSTFDGASLAAALLDGAPSARSTYDGGPLVAAPLDGAPPAESARGEGGQEHDGQTPAA